MGRWQADLISVPYDAGDMVDLARAKEAENWDQAITKGWFK